MSQAVSRDGSTSHADRSQPLLRDYSAEITAKETKGLTEAAPLLAAGMRINLAFLDSETMDQRVDAARHIRGLGFEPMPHVSARRIRSHDELDGFIERLVAEAGVTALFLVAGDPATPDGPFADSLRIIESGLLEKHGIRTAGIGGHPDGHPVIATPALWDWMERKVAALEARGIAPMLITQMAFDAEAVLRWIDETRRRGVHAPIRIGVPGPAGIRQLLRFAKICGVGASTAVLKKYGISLANVLGNAGPDRFVDSLHGGLTPAHGRVNLHFYPMGNLRRSAEWVRAAK